MKKYENAIIRVAAMQYLADTQATQAADDGNAFDRRLFRSKRDSWEWRADGALRMVCYLYNVDTETAVDDVEDAIDHFSTPAEALRILLL